MAFSKKNSSAFLPAAIRASCCSSFSDSNERFDIRIGSYMNQSA